MKWISTEKKFTNIKCDRCKSLPSCIHQSMMGFIVCVCYFFMTIVDISTSAKDGKLDKKKTIVKTFWSTTMFLSARFIKISSIFWKFTENFFFFLKLLTDLESFSSSKYIEDFNDEVAEMSNSADVLRMKKTISVVVLMCHYILREVSFLWKFDGMKLFGCMSEV